MTYALFDDAGKFHAGRVMNESDASMQVELDSGKRVKVKSANVMLKFEQPAPVELMSRARALAEELRAEAHAALVSFGSGARRLRELADFIVLRKF